MNRLSLILNAEEYIYKILKKKIKLVIIIIIWQGKSERSDWSFLGHDSDIRTVSVETVISYVFFAFESQQIQNKHGPSVI